MKIGITGGAGFIGTNLARRLLGEGFEVSVLDDFSTGLLSNVEGTGINIEKGSICDTKTVERFVGLNECIVHLAARGSVPRSIKNPRATIAVNVQGTLEILEAARKEKKQVIFSSSSSVYGRNLEIPKRENQWVGPITPYAASKMGAESLTQAYAATYDFNVVTLRFFNIFGPWQRPDHDYAAVIPKWIWLAMNNQPIDLHGDGEQTRDFTYVDTATDVITTAIKENIKFPSPINLAYGNRVSLNSLIGLLKIRFPNLKINHLPARQGDVLNSQNNPELLNKIFPDIDPVKFERALENTIEWLEKNSKLITNGPPVED